MSTTLPVYHAKTCGVFLSGGVCNCKAQVISRVFCPNENCPNHAVGWIPRVAVPRKCPGCQRPLRPKVAPQPGEGVIGAN
jgi:hypothetical protein